MSLPDSRRLSPGTKIRLLAEFPRESFSGRSLPAIPANTSCTVQFDVGGGKVYVSVPWKRCMEVVYLFEHNAQVIPDYPAKSS